MKNITRLINIPLPKLLTNILEKSGTKTYHVVQVEERDSWSRPDSWCEYHETEEAARQSVIDNNKMNKPGPVPEYYVLKKYLGKQTFKLQASWVKV